MWSVHLAFFEMFGLRCSQCSAAPVFVQAECSMEGQSAVPNTPDESNAWSAEGHLKPQP